MIATQKQTQFITKLLDGKAHDFEADYVSGIRISITDDLLTKKVASRLIDRLLKFPWKPRNSQPQTRVEPGFYVVQMVPEGYRPQPDEDVDPRDFPATTYKVQPSRSSDRTYAKRLVIDRQLADSDDPNSAYTDEVRWEYAPGVMGEIAKHGRRLTIEEAQEFGKTHGFCMICARLLTNEESIERGIGPICASKF